MGYLLLAVSIVFEVLATSALPSTKGYTVRKNTIIVITMYVICFAAFGFCLKYIDLGVAWATWGAVGTAVTPIAGYLFYKQKITKTGVFALALIIVSTVALNVFA